MTDTAEPMAEVRELAPVPDPPPPPAVRAPSRRQLARMSAADRQVAARQAWRDSGEKLNDAQLGEMFDRSPRWGRDQIAQARAEDAGIPAELPETGADEGEPLAPTARPSTRGRRAVVAAVALPLAIVVVSPLVVSFASLTSWATEALGLDTPLAWAVPVTLDAAGMTCVALSFHAMLRADSAGAARALVWLFAGASAVANWRHGSTIGPDAEVYYPAMPLVAALLLDITFRRVRRTALDGLGGLERPLPRYRAARWLIAPVETWGAWSAAVREGYTDPQDALAHYRAGAKQRRT